jgi:ABC-2 type transport system ATP-binding protein
MNIIEVKNLSKTFRLKQKEKGIKGSFKAIFKPKYKNKKAVDNISFNIEKGEILAFIGPNGAGKSTTIKSVVGILPFTSGEVLINGKSIKNDPLACKRDFAYIPDNPDLYESLTGIQYINFICDIFKVSNREDEINKYADIFEIRNDLTKPTKSYSHGMRQKLAIISALVHHPK